MWKVEVEITLTSDEYTETVKDIQVQIEESIPEGFQDLDRWEQSVRKLGFQVMRELYKRGIELFEEKVLSEYRHKRRRGKNKCHVVRRSIREFTLATVFGKVRFPRQRMYCKTCRQWVIPINDALGLHDDEQERATTGFKELSSLCAIHQPYRLAAEKMEQITQDPQVISHQQIKLIVQEEGKRVREREEEERKDAVFCFIKALKNRPYTSPGILNFALPSGSDIYADSAYTDYSVEDALKEMDGIHLSPNRKKNSKRYDEPPMRYYKKLMRVRIETTFSQISAFFPKWIHAVTLNGFLLKVAFFIFAFTMDRVL